MNYSLYDITFVVCRKTSSGECEFHKKHCIVRLDLTNSYKANINITIYALVEMAWHRGHKNDFVISVSAFNWRTGETIQALTDVL